MKLISIEDQIIKATINALINAGYWLSLDDGEEMIVNRSINPGLIFAAMKTTDEDFLVAHMDSHGRSGWVRFICGNGETEVINDYTVNLEPVMTSIFEMINKYEEGG